MGARASGRSREGWRCTPRHHARRNDHHPTRDADIHSVPTTALVTYFQPLRRKLLLLIVGLLCLVVGAFGWLADRQLEGALSDAAAARLTSAAQRIAAMLDESGRRMRGDVAQLAADPAVAAMATRPSAAAAAGAHTALAALASPASQVGVRSLWGLGCTLLVSTAPTHSRPHAGWCPDSTFPPGALAASARHGAWITPFAADGDSVRFAIVAPVVRGRADTLGYVVETRLLASGGSATLIGALIGSDASMLLGNADGPSLWTDLARPVAAPRRLAREDSAETFVDGHGARQIGVVHRVSGAPWSVWVQLPRTAAVATARGTLWALGGIALFCVLAGAVGAWAVSDHVTAPLADVVRAADDLAAGHYDRRVAVTRHDELGQLMTSFNAMAAQVEAATQSLTEQADELQQRMEVAQALAEELELSNQELLDATSATNQARRDSAVVRSLLDDVLTRAPVGIGVFDAELRYLRLNTALADMNGVAVDAHLGRPVSAVGSALGALAEPMLRRVLATGDTVSNHRVSIDALKRHWLASFFPVRGAAGEITGAAVIAMETTAHRELEAQLLQAQKMEAVGRLAGGVAHDFNNLLTVITSYSAMALDGLAPDAPLRGDVEEIRGAAERAAALTKQLLAFSRKQMMRPQVVSLNDVAADMERLLRRLIGEDVRLTLDLAPDLGSVLADPGQLQQVVMNLAVNARDAMPDGGELRIETANAHLSSELALGELGATAGEYVTLSVCDSGGGMSAETQSHLFEPFFTTKPAGQGTGLGLPTVYGIVKQSGGDIHVHSELGHGSTFKIYLPRYHAVAGTRRITPAAPRRAGGSETILLAEDDSVLRSLVTRVLRRAGYTVLEARTAEEAIAIGAAHVGPVDLLLTDVVMPELSGRAVGERLAAARPGLRVLYMSGYTDDDVVRRGVVAAQAEFLQKPFTPEHLTARVRAVLDGSGSLRPAAGVRAAGR